MRKSTIRFIGYCVAIVYTIYMFTGGLMPTQAEVDAQVEEKERLQIVEEKNEEYRERVKYKLELVSITDTNGVEIPKYTTENIEDYENVLFVGSEPLVVDINLIISTSEKAAKPEPVEDFDPERLRVKFSGFSTDEKTEVLNFDPTTGEITLRYSFSSYKKREFKRETFSVRNPRLDSTVQSNRIPFLENPRSDHPSGVAPVSEVYVEN